MYCRQQAYALRRNTLDKCIGIDDALPRKIAQRLCSALFAAFPGAGSAGFLQSGDEEPFATHMARSQTETVIWRVDACKYAFVVCIEAEVDTFAAEFFGYIGNVELVFSTGEWLFLLHI